MFKKYLISVLSPSPVAYFQMLQGEEAAFWMSECKSTVYQHAWNYRPRIKGVWYLSKLIMARMILPYLILGLAILTVLSELIALVP